MLVKLLFKGLHQKMMLHSKQGQKLLLKLCKKLHTPQSCTSFPLCHKLVFGPDHASASVTWHHLARSIEERSTDFENAASLKADGLDSA